MTTASPKAPFLPDGLLLAVEIALFALIFWGDAAGLVPLSKTPFLFLVAWASLRLRGLSWRSAGLRLDESWLPLVGIGLLAGLAFWSLEFFVENPVLHALTGKYPELSMFDDLVGNLTLLFILLGLNLVLAAFGEELVWRGYALPRAAEMFGGTKAAWIVALVAVNAVFGLAHLYQGEAGIIQATVQGVLLGLLYLATGRNLLAPIAAHFTANSCDFVTMYLGLYPGVGGAG